MNRNNRYNDYGGGWYEEKKRPEGAGGLYFLCGLFLVCAVVSVIIAKQYRNGLSEPGDLSADLSSLAVSSDAETPPPDTAGSPEDVLTQRVQAIVGEMTLEQKVGQLFMMRGLVEGDLMDLVTSTNPGGAILFADDFKGKSADQVREMIAGLQSAAGGRLLMAVDEEGGTVVRVSSNKKLRKSKFQSPQALYKEGGMARIESDTLEKCELLSSLSLNMNMAPVADVCTNASGFMYKRAFGQDAAATAEYVSTVVRVMGETQVASCVKHFPGYGDSKADTHKGIDVNEKTLDELRECDLIPFQAAIENGVDGIMLTHTIIQSVDSERPASLSPDVVALIRNELGFDGVIISDGLEMGAVIDYSGGDSGKVCIMAMQAGVDILCAPKNPRSDYRAVLKAVRNGEIAESRVDEAVGRIVRLKIRLGLYE